MNLALTRWTLLSLPWNLKKSLASMIRQKDESDEHVETHELASISFPVLTIT